MLPNYTLQAAGRTLELLVHGSNYLHYTLRGGGAKDSLQLTVPTLRDRHTYFLVTPLAT